MTTPTAQRRKANNLRCLARQCSASTRNTGINNLMGALVRGLKAYSSFYKPV